MEVHLNDNPSLSDLENWQKDAVFDRWLFAIKKFYECPINKANYEEWLKRRKCNEMKL